MINRVNAGARCCFGATPLVGELPRSNGQTAAWPSAPSRALRVIKEVNAGEKVDLDWLRQGGGFIKNKHAPAGRFNLGEKLVYWLSLVAGIAVSLSGLLLLFPFYGTDIADMQVAQGAHAVVAVLFVALILAHIYIGTLGMEGAFEAMGQGDVDLNWAKEHHATRKGAWAGTGLGDISGMNAGRTTRRSGAHEIT